MTLKDVILMENKAVLKEMIDPGAISEREEGEISDLDLEDVSDCSLTSNKSYKNYSKSKRDTLYFSCVSENDSESDIIPSSGCNVCRSYNCDGFRCAYNKLPHRTYHEKRRRYKYKCNKSKSRVVVSVSSDSDGDKAGPVQILSSSSDSENESVDRSLLLKLNKAVRVNAETTDQLQTSLRTRIKKMIDHDEGKSDSEYELMELRKVALESKLRECVKQEKLEDNRPLLLSDSETCMPIGDNVTSTPKLSPIDEVKESNGIVKDDITDAEAQQLRLDALRSAVLKKHELRRQKQNAVIEKPIKIEKTDGPPEQDEVTMQIKTVINDLIEYIITDHNSSDCSLAVSEDKGEVSTGNNKENEENLSQPLSVINDETIDKTPEEDEDILRAMLLTSIAKKISEENVPEQEVVKTTKKLKTVTSRSYQKSDKPVNVAVKPLVINVGDDSSEDDNTNKTKSEVSANFEASLSQLLREARANAEKQQPTAQSTKMPSAVQRLPESRQAEYLQLKNRLEQLKQNQTKVSKFKQKSSTLQTQISTVGLPSTFLNKPQRLSKKVNRFTTNEFQFVNKNRINHLGHKILVPTTEQNKQNIKTAMQLKQNSMISNLVSQKRFLEGKYKDLAPIVKKTKAARLARDKAGREVKKLMQDLELAKAQYDEQHQTYKNCIQQYLLLKAKIEADSTPTLDNQKRKIEETEQLRKRQKLGEQSTVKTQNVISTATNDNVKVQAQPMKMETLDVAVAEVVSTLPKEVASIEPVDIKNEDESAAVTEKRRSIDTNPLIEVCPFDLQGSCRDTECKYRHLGNND